MYVVLVLWTDCGCLLMKQRVSACAIMSAGAGYSAYLPAEHELRRSCCQCVQLTWEHGVMADLVERAAAADAAVISAFADMQQVCFPPPFANSAPGLKPKLTKFAQSQKACTVFLQPLMRAAACVMAASAASAAGNFAVGLTAIVRCQMVQGHALGSDD